MENSPELIIVPHISLQRNEENEDFFKNLFEIMNQECVISIKGEYVYVNGCKPEKLIPKYLGTSFTFRSPLKRKKAEKRLRNRLLRIARKLKKSSGGNERKKLLNQYFKFTFKKSEIYNLTVTLEGLNMPRGYAHEMYGENVSSRKLAYLKSSIKKNVYTFFRNPFINEFVSKYIERMVIEKNEKNGTLEIKTIKLVHEPNKKIHNETIPLDNKERIIRLVAQGDAAVLSTSLHSTYLEVGGMRQMRNQMFKEKERQFKETNIEIFELMMLKSDLLNFSKITKSKQKRFHSDKNEEILLSEKEKSFCEEMKTVVIDETLVSSYNRRKGTQKLNVNNLKNICKHYELSTISKKKNELYYVINDFFQGKEEEEIDVSWNIRRYNSGWIQGSSDYCNIGACFPLDENTLDLFLDAYNLYPHFNTTKKKMEYFSAFDFASFNNEIWSIIQVDGTRLDTFNVNFAFRFLSILQNVQSSYNQILFGTYDGDENQIIVKKVLETVKFAQFLEILKRKEEIVCFDQQKNEIVTKKIKIKVFHSADYGYLMKVANFSKFYSTTEDVAFLKRISNLSFNELISNEEIIEELKKTDKMICFWCHGTNCNHNNPRSFEELRLIFIKVNRVEVNLDFESFIMEMLHLIKNDTSKVLFLLHQKLMEKNLSTSFEDHVTSCWNTFVVEGGNSVGNTWKVTTEQKELKYPTLTGTSARELGARMDKICGFFAKHGLDDSLVFDEENDQLRSLHPYAEFGLSYKRIVILGYRLEFLNDVEVKEYCDCCFKCAWIWKCLFSWKMTPSIHTLFHCSPVFMIKFKTLGLFTTEGLESANSEYEEINEISKGSFGGSKYVQRLKFQLRRLFQLKNGMRPDLFKKFFKKKRKRKERTNMENEN